MGTVNLGPQPSTIELSRRLRSAGFDGYADAALAAHNRETFLRDALGAACVALGDIADLKPRYREGRAVQAYMAAREALGWNKADADGD